MASTEDKAYEIMKELDVDYVLVIFGGLTGYSSDGKFNNFSTQPILSLMDFFEDINFAPPSLLKIRLTNYGIFFNPFNFFKSYDHYCYNHFHHFIVIYV